MIFLMHKNQKNFIVDKFTSAFFFFSNTFNLTHCWRSESDKDKIFLFFNIFMCPSILLNLGRK